jgi:hypothetical protein
MFDNASGKWLLVENITTNNSVSQYYPTIGIDQRRFVYVAWECADHPSMIYLSRKSSSSINFESPILVTDGSQFTGIHNYPSIMGHGPNCYPKIGTALVWTGEINQVSTDVMFFTYGQTDYKVKFNIITKNKCPELRIDDVLFRYSFEVGNTIVDLELYDQGSDDLCLTWDWGDGTNISSAMYYNNGLTPEPPYPPTHSAFNGTAPFIVPVKLVHVYSEIKDYWLNLTLTDDDGCSVNKSVLIHFVTAMELKEYAIDMLEPLVPGRLDILGYRNITLQYNGGVDPILLVYNVINRMPYSYNEKLLMSFCNVQPGDILEINGSMLEVGMFGTELKLRLYDEQHNLLDESVVDTTYSCLDYLEIGDQFGLYTVLGFEEFEDISYHHYSQYALNVENALDHTLRSLNRDPRRGYGWWHEVWVWWCGYWEFRQLWIDESRLDPQYGSVVFCEERYAVRNLMEVVLNCLEPTGVAEIEFMYLGSGVVDIEVYTLRDDWWNGTWDWIYREYDIMTGDTFRLDGSMCNSTKLGRRIMFRVFDAVSGDELDTVYVRTSGEWPLEVMPGNIYDEYWQITDSVLIIGGNYTEWHEWGDTDWWDFYFNFIDYSGAPNPNGPPNGSRCGWDVEACADPIVAAEEKARVCSNLTVLLGAIKMLVMADWVIARQALSDAENTTVANASYIDEYNYYIKIAWRYVYAGDREQNKGAPHHAISDYKNSWVHSVMALKYAFKKNAGDLLGDMYDQCDYTCPCMYSYPWWMEWYMQWSNWQNPCS